MVFHCYLDTAFGHVFAAFFGVAIAAASVLPLYGFGQFGSLLNARIFRWLGLYVLRHSADVCTRVMLLARSVLAVFAKSAHILGCMRTVIALLTSGDALQQGLSFHVAFLDNVNNGGRLTHEGIPTLQHILNDIWHVQKRITDTISPGSSMMCVQRYTFICCKHEAMQT